MYLTFESSECALLANNFCKPASIPRHPEEVYKEYWKGFGHWLGTGNKPGPVPKDKRKAQQSVFQARTTGKAHVQAKSRKRKRAKDDVGDEKGSIGAGRRRFRLKDIAGKMKEMLASQSVRVNVDLGVPPGSLISSLIWLFCLRILWTCFFFVLISFTKP